MMLRSEWRRTDTTVLVLLDCVLTSAVVLTNARMGSHSSDITFCMTK